MYFFVLIFYLNIAINLCCYEKQKNTKLRNSIPSENLMVFFNVFYSTKTPVEKCLACYVKQQHRFLYILLKNLMMV